MRIRASIAAAAWLIAAFWPASGARAEPLSLPKGEYVYNAATRQVPVAGVLAEFAGNFKLNLKVEEALPGQVTGRMSAASPEEFLNKLSSVYGLAWHYNQGVLWVSRRSSMVTRALRVEGLRITGLKKALEDGGVLDPKFSWGEIAEQNRVVVTGPASYVKFVERRLADLADPPAKEEVIVVRLRHAQATDTVIRLENQEVRVPGVASILRRLFGAEPPSTLASERMMRVLSSGEPAAAQDEPASRGKADASLGNWFSGRANPALAQVDPVGAPQPARPVIEEDVHNNAIVIHGPPGRRALYEKTIRELDQPMQLLEIDVAAIDVDMDSTVLALRSDAPNAAQLMDPSLRGAARRLDRFMDLRGMAEVDASEFLAAIQELDGRHLAHVVSRPTVMTLNRVPARLEFNESQAGGSMPSEGNGFTFEVTPGLVDGGQRYFVQLRMTSREGIGAGGASEPARSRNWVVSSSTVLDKRNAIVIAGHTVERSSLAGTGSAQALAGAGTQAGTEDLEPKGAAQGQWQAAQMHRKFQRLFLLSVRSR